MHLASVRLGEVELPGIVDPERGFALVRDLPLGDMGHLGAIIVNEDIGRILGAARSAPDSIFLACASLKFCAPYRHPRMVLGIGLNYVEHAKDLKEVVPDEPASFIKGDHTVIGPGENIPIPNQSQRTTAEAELGIVIGRYCRNVEPSDALGHVAGFCPVLDQTAEDILERNPRFLTRAKNFPGFFSFGPAIVPLNDAIDVAGSMEEIEISTVLNGTVHCRNTVSNMRYDPAFLISFHSKVMPLFPGDILATGTPGAVHIRAGDVVECRIPGVGTLRNSVVAGE